MAVATPQLHGLSNGNHHPGFDVATVLEALQLIHNPSTKNEVRIEASKFLDQVKSSPEAPQHGFTLGTDTSQPPLIQHFGLSLLGHVIRHEGHHLSDGENTRLRECVLSLANSMTLSQPAFIRNKISELWIELAKRSWAIDWFDMDEKLVRLWSQDSVHKDCVLTVLENLSEDVFVRDDTVAVLRGRELNAALVEIFTSTSNYSGGIQVGENVYHMRCGDEGWLRRITDFVAGALSNGNVTGQMKDIVIKALGAFRSIFTWVMTPAVISSGAMETVCSALTQKDSDMIIAACDALLSLYGRLKLEEVEVQALVHPLLHPDSVSLLQRLYEWSVVTVDDIDSPRYTISKKLSELLSLFSDHICQHTPPDEGTLDLGPFINLLTIIAGHESLIVSIPIVHAWVKMLEVKAWRLAVTARKHVHAFVEVASRRVIQYDQLPSEPPHPVVVFVNDEIELHPERQGFYINYRRLCGGVVEWACLASPSDVMPFIMNRAGQILAGILSSQVQFNPSQYERVSDNILQADAAFTLVDAAGKGVDRMYLSPTEQQEFRTQLRSWYVDRLRGNNFHDPQIRQRQIRSAVEAANRVFQHDTEYAFIVLEHVLVSFMTKQEAHVVYTEAVDELSSYATNELRRLSLQHADYFVTFLEQIEAKFTELIGQIGANDRVRIELKSTLFSIVQRATAIDAGQRQARLEVFMRPIAASWSSPTVQNTLGSVEAFIHSQAFDQVAPYLASLNAGSIEDWTSVPYDGRGIRIQGQMTAGFAALPLRETRILLSISTERLGEGSEALNMVSSLWSSLVPTILEYVLRTTGYNHQLHDPASWPGVTPQSRPIIQRVLRDRYWQSGISSGSMGEFHSKVKATKSTLEGFASSVRGRIRNNLEQCYSILHTLARLGPVFYGFQQLPQLFAQFAIDSTGPLSPHHFSTVLQMLPKLIDECPPANRQHFLTPILSSLLVQMDTKLSHAWEKMGQRKQVKHDDEDLSDEMRDESVLRNTTQKAVNLVSLWLNPNREQALSTKKSLVNNNHLADLAQPTMRDFVLASTELLEKLLVFLTHALAFKDTKTSKTALNTIQRLIPDYATDRYLRGDAVIAAREYLSKNMLEVAITCLHDSYFADDQQHYAHLIATIWLCYGLPTHHPATEGKPAHENPPLTNTPRSVLLSLSGITESKVDNAATLLLRETGGGSTNVPKKTRAMILSLLEGVRGVRVSELGKIDTKQQQSRILEKYKQRDLLSSGMQGVDGDGQQAHDGSEMDLGGVAAMFGS
jgi:exportin-5